MVYGDRSPVFEARNCEFVGANFNCALDWACPLNGQMTVENCLQVGGNRGVVFHYLTFDQRDVAVRLNRNTIVTSQPVTMFLDPVPDLQLIKPIRVEAAENVLDAHYDIFGFIYHANRAGKAKPLKSNEVGPLLTRLLTWRDSANIYTDRCTFSLWDIDKSNDFFPGIKTLEDWQQLWGTKDNGSSAGRIQYQGGDIFAKVANAPLQFTPNDARLAKGSPGQGKGAKAKDLGADVDLVGPGAAYERWKATPAYQEWRKQADALMIAAAKAP